MYNSFGVIIIVIILIFNKREVSSALILLFLRALQFLPKHSPVIYTLVERVEWGRNRLFINLSIEHSSKGSNAGLLVWESPVFTISPQVICIDLVLYSGTWPGGRFTKIVTSDNFVCYKLLKPLLLIGYQQIWHLFLSFVIEKRLCETGSWRSTRCLYPTPPWRPVRPVCSHCPCLCSPWSLWRMMPCRSPPPPGLRGWRSCWWNPGGSC